MKPSIVFLSFTVICIGFLYSCTSVNADMKSSCIDGWNVDNTGRSVIWAIPDKSLKTILQQLPPNRVIACTHKMPSDKIIVINYFGLKYYASSFSAHDGYYTFIDEDMLVTTH